MIYRTHVAILLAVPDMWSKIPEAERNWHDAVAYTFGINAHDPSEANSLAIAAAQSARGRDGEFIGGIVVETHCRCVDSTEFDDSKKYFHKPIDQRGIFYVSGVCTFQISKEKTKAVTGELETLREKIKRSGLPAASFIHPKLTEVTLSRMRLVCEVCHRWIEIDGLDFMHSFMGGLMMFSDEQREIWKSRRGASGPFVHRHLSECFMGCHPGPSGITAVHENEPRWSTLEESSREEENEE